MKKIRVVSGKDIEESLKEFAISLMAEYLETEQGNMPVSVAWEVNARGVRVASVLEPEKYCKTEADKKFVEEFDLFGCKRIETIVYFVRGTTNTISHMKIVKYY